MEPPNMPKATDADRQYIGKELPDLKYLTGRFFDEEFALLKRFGAWMDALAKGELQPSTPDQISFVAAALGNAKPKSRHEHVWEKWKKVHAEFLTQTTPQGERALRYTLQPTCAACGSNSPNLCRCSE